MIDQIDEKVTGTPTPDAPALAVLISGRGSNLHSIIAAIRSKQLNATVKLVISNVENAGGLEIARSENITTLCIPHIEFDDREAFDLAVGQQLNDHGIEWVVLAGFMRILGHDFANCWRGKLINIHPSLLPQYPGLNTHARALEAGDQQAGASVHFVTPQLDGGPVILQGVVDVEPEDTAGTLAVRVLEVEHEIFPMALEWLISGRVKLGLAGETESVWENDKPREHIPTWYQGKLLK